MEVGFGGRWRMIVVEGGGWLWWKVGMIVVEGGVSLWWKVMVVVGGRWREVVMEGGCGGRWIISKIPQDMNHLFTSFLLHISNPLNPSPTYGSWI